MSDTVISVENLGKRYSLRHKVNGERYITLRDVIARQAAAPFKAIGERLRVRSGPNGSGPHGSNASALKDSVEDFWALKDVSFKASEGDVLGIIGRNGAGKSTLLKVLTRITEPTKGRVRIKGRVTSLLEVGTGFHPELTGRENIYLNGAILGMSQAEIKAKFDEIVVFADVEKFLDTPVKRYSSGMYVRLAFAVAAHLEPEVLIVDEVLAVGDAEFQKKCLGKMHDVALRGRTVLFVSHNLQAVSALCNRALLLAGGSLVCVGSVKETIELYLSTFSKTKGSDELLDRRPGSGEYRYTSASPAREYFGGAEEKSVTFELERRGRLVGNMWLSAHIVDPSGVELADCDSRLVGTRVEDCERFAGRFRFITPWLKPGSYRVDLSICAAGGILDKWEGACWLTITPVLPYLNPTSGVVPTSGLVFADFALEAGELIRDGEGELDGYKRVRDLGLLGRNASGR